MSRKVYDRQFKMAAFQLVLEENLFVKEVAKELSIHPNTLYRWISEYEEYGESAFPGCGSALYNSQYEMKKLKSENEELRKELRENYNNMPVATENLLKVVKLRILASKLGITSIKSVNKTLKIKYEMPEKDWRRILNKNQDLIRWQWSLNEISTKASTSPEADLNLLEKFLHILMNFMKDEEKSEVA